MPPVDFDLRQLEIFVKVVDHKSFSRAADEVHLAQASVSERIANLEKAVGTRLLDRMGRQAVPTKAGDLLYKHASLLLDMKKNVCLEMDKFLGLRQGDIRIGASTVPGEYIFPEILGRFRKIFPFVTISLTVADTQKIEDLVHSGRLELGLIGRESSNRDIICCKIWKDELVLVVNRDHKWAKKQEIDIQELLQEPFIAREQGSGTLKIMGEYLDKIFKPGAEKLNIIAELGTSTAVKEGIKADLGVSILSSRAIRTEMEAGILKVIGLKNSPPMTRSFYLIMDKRRTPSPMCRAIYDYILDCKETENLSSGRP